MVENLKKQFLNKRNLYFIAVGIVLLVIFYSFSFVVKEDLLHGHDFAVTVKVQNFIPIRIDPFLSWFSILGSFEVTLGILILIVALRRKITGIILVGMFGFMHVVEIIGKAFLDHPGTPFMFHRYALDVVFPSSYVQPGGSYPSGHSMRSTYLAVILLYIIFTSKKPPMAAKLFMTFIIFTILFIMYISRVSLGEHWTTDVIGGALLGAAFAFFSLVFI